MANAAIPVLLYGLLAGLSPLAFAATLTVMPAGRLKVLGFGAGFVGAQLLTCSALVVIGIAATGWRTGSHPGVRAALELALALALVALAVRARRRPPDAVGSPIPDESSSPRVQALLERLGRLRLLTTVVAGFLLGFGGPKRLVLTALAATTIVAAGLRDAAEASLVVLYVTLASALVWVPAVLFLFLGEHVVALMKRLQREVGRGRPQLAVYALLLIAAFFVIDAVALLLSA